MRNSSRAPPESPAEPRTYASARRLRAIAALAGLVACAPGSASETPLVDWLDESGKASQALADGKPEAAEAAARAALAARPRGLAAARVSASLGLALRARGANREAAEALEEALASPTATARPHLSFARGEALLLSGDAPAAARLLGEAARADGLAVGRRAGFLEGRALVAADLPGEAVPLLEELLRRHPDDPSAPAARLDLAEARRAAGDPPGAVALLRQVWLDAGTPEAEVAGARLAAWRSAAGPVPAPSPADHLARAERLVADARPDEALREVAAAYAASPTAERPALGRVLRAAALLAQGQAAEAEAEASSLGADADEGVRRGALLVVARAAARAGRLDVAMERYREVGRLSAPIPGLPGWRQRDIGDEATYLAAWLPYDAGDYDRAASALDAFARANPRSRRLDDALWFAAWSRLRLGRRAEAVRALGRLSTGPVGDAAAYWQARFTTAPARRRALYERASTLGGDGWYGLLARARLAELGTPAPRPARPLARLLPDAPDPQSSGPLSLAVELFGLGLTDDGLAELRDVAGSPRARAAAPLLAQLAAFAGDAELPFRMARDHLGPTRRALRWSHPEPFPELVGPAAAAAGLDPALALAVMRRESSFRRVVRSHAGAEGLLQLRPATAERVATLLELAPGMGSRLGDPAVNLPLGIHYLGLLASRFEHPAVALAGYNAGPGQAAAWAGARAGMPLDEWVECVPYKETRQYVKVVLADWDVYRDLHGDPPAPVQPGHLVPKPGPGVGF